MLARHRLDPARLCLEMTESAMMDDASASIVVLERLKRIGVQLAIDDFGTGYSSLEYLKRLPVDHVKIDRSFVDGLGNDAEDTAIVTAVVRLAHSLGLRTVAEGVETIEQLAELTRLGFDYAQGFYWSPAVDQEALMPELARPPGTTA
jgi:EAL domain-containing protein (putative c-di-GMP-specific phosphodiesterase class I)